MARATTCLQWDAFPTSQQMIAGVYLSGLPLENRVCIWVNLENILRLLWLLLTRPVLVGNGKIARTKAKGIIYNPSSGEPLSPPWSRCTAPRMQRGCELMSLVGFDPELCSPREAGAKGLLWPDSSCAPCCCFALDLMTPHSV